MKVLVTGGAGYIGSAVCRHLILDLGHDVVVVDKLTYAGNMASLAPVADLRRIQQMRSVLEADPGFLVSLDGPTDQRPCLFAQIYAQDAAAGGSLTQAAITAMFDQADVLAAFFTPPP